LKRGTDSHIVILGSVRLREFGHLSGHSSQTLTVSLQCIIFNVTEIDAMVGTEDLPFHYSPSLRFEPSPLRAIRIVMYPYDRRTGRIDCSDLSPRTAARYLRGGTPDRGYFGLHNLRTEMLGPRLLIRKKSAAFLDDLL
jgi:hypothetical protein